MSFLTVTSKTLNWFWGARATGSLWSGLHCWTVEWAAKLTAVESQTQFSVDVQSTSRWNQISLNCVGRQQSLFCFFQLQTVVMLFF